MAVLGIGAMGGVPAVDAVDLYFSSEKFCAHTCHVMEDTVYEEYLDSTHGQTATGVRPTCADCHISRRITVAMWDHLLGMRELVTFLANDFSAPDAFEEYREEAAHKVRMGMLKSDSYTCRQCHVMELIKPEKRRGQKMHAKAKEEGTTCIACHYNLVHKDVRPRESFTDAADKIRFKKDRPAQAEREVAEKADG